MICLFRDLKGIYLTILENKSIDELRHQRDSLQHLLDLSLKLAQEKKDEKLRERQERSRKRHAEELRKRQQSSNDGQSQPDENLKQNQEHHIALGDNNEDHLDTIDKKQQTLQNENKHRRDTLRKQIHRLDEQIHKLEELHKEKLVSEPVLPNPKGRCGYGCWNT